MWWTLVMSAASTLIAANAQSNQNESQEAWNKYNAQMGYSNDMNNIEAQYALTGMNAKMQMAAAQMNATAATQAAEYNASLIKATTMYNDSLLQNDESLLWEEYDLDLHNLEAQRSVERGTIEAVQSASGITMNQDTFADVITDQMTQEALDAFVLRRNADIEVSKINNARAKNLWEGESQARKVIWEGNMAAISSVSNARLQATGAMMQGALQRQAGMMSAGYSYDAGMAGANLQSSQNKYQINQGMMSGLFGAAQQGVSSYYGNKQVANNNVGATQSQSATPGSSSRSTGYIQNNSGNYSLGNYGQSLLG